MGPGIVAHPVISTLWEAKAGRLLEVRNFRPAWPTWWNLISTKNTKISWAWWQMPIIPATQEAEAGELLEAGRQRLQWAQIAPLHSSLDDRVRLCLKKQSKTKCKCEATPKEWKGICPFVCRNGSSCSVGHSNRSSNVLPVSSGQIVG